MSTYTTDLETFRSTDELQRFVNSVENGIEPAGWRVLCGGQGGHPFVTKVDGCDKWTTIGIDNMVVVHYKPDNKKPLVERKGQRGYDIITTNVNGRNSIDIMVCWACDSCRDKLSYTIEQEIYNSIDMDNYTVFKRLMRRFFKSA